MNAGEEDLRELVSSIWGEMLGLEVRAAASSRSGNGTSRHVVGSVSVSGAWEGVVAVDCPPELARRAAGAMFGCEPGVVTSGEVLDAMGELANITGGNVKALLPGPSRLSLPAVAEGAGPAQAPAGHPLVRAAFESGGIPFTVTVQGAPAA